MEAVKLGTATVGLKNREAAVLVALCKPTSELSATQRKIIPIDDHLGISIAGITADARVLSRYLRSECQWFSCNQALYIYIIRVGAFFIIALSLHPLKDFPIINKISQNKR